MSHVNARLRLALLQVYLQKSLARLAALLTATDVVFHGTNGWLVYVQALRGDRRGTNRGASDIGCDN